MNVENGKILKISIIIPHYNGIKILDACISSILKNDFSDYEIIVVDNGSKDGSQEFVRREYPQVHLIQSHKNLGYAGGCNLGIRSSEAEFVLLLNNDVEVADNFLQELYNAIIADDQIAIVQPKILSIQNKEMFDYSGGAGGELDIFGYPFARGRVFISIEKDENQYEDFPNEIFWASGTACLIRRSVLQTVGLLDEYFFAHMEEIDLNWRMHLAGYKVAATLKTYVYHYSGYTLSAHNPRKMYLNHRNNIIMLIKNYSIWSLLWIIPARSVLEVAALLYALYTKNLAWAYSVIRGVGFVVVNMPKILKKHFRVQKLRKISDKEIRKKMYGGSVALSFFLLKKKSIQICSFRKQNI